MAAGSSAGRREDVPSTATVWRAVARFGLLPSRLEPQRLHVTAVERRLATELAGLRTPLVVLSAPAGSGKTIALVQWRSAESRPVAWLCLDASDNDPVVFVAGLFAALSPIVEPGPQALELLQRSSARLHDRVIPRLGESLRRAPPFVLMLDDCQLLHNAECWTCLETLLELLPAGATVALGTREAPPLPLARLRAEARLEEVGADRLALSPVEVRLLLQAHGVPASEALVDELLRLTEGWATGLHLVLDADGGKRPADLPEEVRGDQRAIAAYFVGEVLEREPPEVQSFLLETSILKELSAPLCAAVTRRDDAGETLDSLARRNLFIAALDQRGEWYRYHHLFAELLQSRLCRSRPRALARLHRAAAAWYERDGHAERAVPHWLAAGAPEKTVRLVERACTDYLESGRQESARRLLQLFTEAQLLADPGLAVTAGWVYGVCVGTPAEQEHWRHIVCSLPLSDGPSWDGSVSLRSSHLLLRAELALDGLTRQVEDFREGVALETRPGTSWYDFAREGYGRALWLTGSARRGEKVLRCLLAEAEDPLTGVWARSGLALILQDAGDWTAAWDLLEGTERLVPGLGLEEWPGYCAYLPLLVARLRDLTYRSDRGAPTFAGLVAAYAERMIHRAPWIQLWAAVMLGEVALDQGDLEAARRQAAHASTVLAAYPDAGILAARARRLSRVLAERASLLVTPAELRVLELLPTHLSPQAIADSLCLSRNTVKTHLRAIYRKLGAASRSEAVARARELGLLRP